MGQASLISGVVSACKGSWRRFSFTVVALSLVTMMRLPCAAANGVAANAPINPPKANTAAASSSHQPASPTVVVNVPQKSWIEDLWPPLVAALVSGGALLLFSDQLQKKLLRLSARLQGQGDTYFRFGERGMEAQFLLFKAQAIRRAVAHPDWPSTAQALQDKEAAIRTLSDPIHAYFPNDLEIGKLYSQFLDLYIKLKRILINHNQWDQAQFEQDQDRLNDLYSEVRLRMGRIIESGKSVSKEDLAEWRKSVDSRREEMRQQ
jgi:hypothetical protein